MKQTKFDPIALLVTALCGLAGAALMAIQERALDGDLLQTCLWMGAFFLVVFLCGFASLHIYLALNRRYRVQRRRLWPVTALVCGALIFGIGAGSQYFYMYSEEEIVDTVVTTSDVDMVLMLDGSGSMSAYGYVTPRNNAASSFVDSLGQDSRLQAAVFAGGQFTLGSTELLSMDSAGKATVKDFINSTDCIGTTNFEAALSEALYTLTTDPNVRPDSGKAVILLTDGDNGILYSDYLDAYTSAGIRLFTVRITNGTFQSSEIKQLISLAQATGGFDTVLTPDADGSVDTSALLQAFQDAFQATSETNVTRVTHLTDNLLICSGSVSFGLTLLRTAALALIFLLFGLGYFGGGSAPALGVNAALGLALSLLTALLGNGSLMLSCLIAGVSASSALVCFEPSGGDGIHV